MNIGDVEAMLAKLERIAKALELIAAVKVHDHCVVMDDSDPPEKVIRFRCAQLKSIQDNIRQEHSLVDGLPHWNEWRQKAEERGQSK